MGNIILSEEDVRNVCESSLTMSEAARKLNVHYNTFKKYAEKYGYWKTNTGGKGTHKKPGTKYELQDILNGKYPEYQTFKLRNRLITEGIKEYKCEICGISEWNNLPISLELHHKDGNRSNHILDNLLLLCPNCHSQTETFRAKNIKNKT